MKRAAVLIGLALLVLVAAFAVAWLIGSRLPLAHRAELSRTLDAPAAEVWRRVDGVASWKEWRSDLDSLEVLGDGTVRIGSQGDVVRYRLERPSPRTLVTEIVDLGLPYGGRWVWSVRPAGEDAATVTVVEEGEVYHPLFRFVSRFVIGHDATIRGVLDQLEASFAASVD